MFAAFSRLIAAIALSTVFTLAAFPALADDSAIDEAAVEATPAEVLFVSAAAPEAEWESEGSFRQEVAAMVESDLMLDLHTRLAEQTPAS